MVVYVHMYVIHINLCMYSAIFNKSHPHPYGGVGRECWKTRRS